MNGDDIYAIARFMTAAPKDVTAVVDFTRALHVCVGESRLGSPLSKQWAHAVEEYIIRISIVGEEDWDGKQWRLVADILKSLDEAGFPGTSEQAGACYYRATDYERATSCWERSGVTGEKEYYLAKAAVLGYPMCLEWLEKAGAYDRIIEAWEKAGGLSASGKEQGLEYVGAALERKQRNREAFNIYHRIGDSPGVRRTFESVSPHLPDAERWKMLVLLIEYLIERELWAEAVGMITQYFSKVAGREEEKAVLHFDVVREIAYSEPIPDGVAYGEQLERFVNEALSRTNWKSYVSVYEAGAALEKIGGMVSALRFYESANEGAVNEIERTFVRERWVAVKRKQVAHWGRKVNREKKEKAEAELATQAHDWKVRKDADLPQYPKLQPSRYGYGGLEGLPAGTVVERIPGGSVKFEIGPIEVRTDRQRKLVLITDTETLNTLRVDVGNLELNGQAKVVRPKSGTDWVNFSVAESGYSGKVWRSMEDARLELKRQGASITIAFPSGVVRSSER